MLIQKNRAQPSRDSIFKNNEGKPKLYLENKVKTNGFLIAQDIELDLKF